jgi:pimeloyl-ACP methyl ester carboxylesterase
MGKVVKNIFRLCMTLLVATAWLVIITPILSFNSLLYPVRIDSVYVSQQQLLHEKKLAEGKTDSIAMFIYTPEQVAVAYMDIRYTLRDSILLRGLMALDTLHSRSPLLLIIPDITEGAIEYIPAMKEFCDRGFNVCVINLRGQGNSDGNFYTPGTASVNDIKQLVADLRKMPFISNVTMLGNGTGAGIVIKANADTSLAEVLVLQNPPATLTGYFRQKAREEWGEFILPLLPALIRSYEDKTGISLETYNYLQLVSKIKVPHMMVTANFMTTRVLDETVAVYNASGYYKKRLYVDAPSFGKKTSVLNEKGYYDRVASFIHISLPSKTKKTRFRRFALIDQR